MSDIILDSAEGLAHIIMNAAPGSIVYLPNEHFVLTESVYIPSGVTVIGRASTTVTFSSGSGTFAFDLSGSVGASVKNISVNISNGKGAIFASNSNNILIDNVTVTGNMFESNSIEFAPNIAIYVDTSDGIIINECAIFNGFGGIYSILSSNVVISHNLLDHTNFGQIVVSGDEIIVNGNRVLFSGVPSENGFIARQGDSFTSLGSTNLQIVGNLFDNPLCYQLAFWEGINSNIHISDNVITNGITNGIYFATDAINLIIEHNLFRNNSESGIFFEKSAYNVFVDSNSFLTMAL